MKRAPEKIISLVKQLPTNALQYLADNKNGFISNFSANGNHMIKENFGILQEFLANYNLNNGEIDRLSIEAKLSSIDCGKNWANRELPPDVGDLFADMSDKVWNSSMSNLQKIFLGFQLFELFPNYFHFLTPFYDRIRSREITDLKETDFIWRNFMDYLAAENYYADPVGYVLWVEFFEDESTVREAWIGLIKNCQNKQSLLRLLEHAGPVPYDLKESHYHHLMEEEIYHEDIFNSLLYSAYDVFGKIENDKALDILAKLKIDREAEPYRLLMEKLGLRN